MSTLVVGDVHGCADEFAALLDRNPADRVVLVGDLFTKGPDPVGVWRLVRQVRAEAVLGNHDARLIATIDGERPDDSAAIRAAGALNAVDSSWRTWLAGRPLFIDVDGWIVVHAMVHPTEGIAATTRDMALTWRRWPDNAPGAPVWWASYTGERPVIFGHDALTGRVRVEREGRPHVIGLDTGCVYGRSLTGYLVEDDRFVEVRARRVYRSPG